jgi:hypothetical protein
MIDGKLTAESLLKVGCRVFAGDGTAEGFLNIELQKHGIEEDLLNIEL